MMCNCNNMNSCNQEQDLMKQIQQISFLLVDLNLYLDNHPDCRQALEDYNILVEAMDELRKVYTQKYGPIMNFGTAKSDCPWQWADDQPWPWENKRR